MRKFLMGMSVVTSLLFSWGRNSQWKWNIFPRETMSQSGNITCPRCHLLDPACALVLAVTPASGATVSLKSAQLSKIWCSNLTTVRCLTVWYSITHLLATTVLSYADLSRAQAHRDGALNMGFGLVRAEEGRREREREEYLDTIILLLLLLPLLLISGGKSPMYRRGWIARMKEKFTWYRHIRDGNGIPIV